MRQIAARELSEWLADAARAQPQLVDVREPWEADICRIQDSLLMPLASLPARAAELDATRPLVAICHHGARSMQAAYFLERNGFAEVCNLTGGVAAWAEQVEPAMARY